MTCHEKILWQYLRRNQILGFQFYRQKVIVGYIVDFYCASAKLVIELDGRQHLQADAMNYDAERTRVLKSLGLTVMRFDNLRIETRISAVLAEIKHKLKAIPPNLPSTEGRSTCIKKSPFFKRGI